MAVSHSDAQAEPKVMKPKVDEYDIADRFSLSSAVDRGGESSDVYEKNWGSASPLTSPDSSESSSES